MMNHRDGSDHKPHHERLWSQPLQAPSRSGNDAQETAILSSITSLHRSRLKRSRTREEEDSEPRHHQRLESDPSGTTMEPIKPVFQLRALSLDRAGAPCLAQPIAPFAKSARKKAYTSAIYYSECFLRNIQPKDADSAAFEIQNRYNKWWIQSKKQVSTKTESTKKRRRLDEQSFSSSSSGEDVMSPSPTPTSSDGMECSPEVATLLKEQLMDQLQKTAGDTTTTEFKRCLAQLRAVYSAQQRMGPIAATMNNINGTWLTLSKPTYSESQGRNLQGEYLYTLGRMSFDMFRPTHLRCSIRAVVNNIREMDPSIKPQSFPSRLSKQLQEHRSDSANPIRHYDIVVAFTIQANQTLRGTDPSGDDNEFVIPRPIRGLLTNHGYMVEDPAAPGRTSIWFSGGSIEPQDEVADAQIWKRIFDDHLAPRRDMGAMANMLAAKLLLGATTTTTGMEVSNDHSSDQTVPIMNYLFKRPIGGHGEVFCDALYVDETLRIMQGHMGSVFVLTRVPDLQESAPHTVTSEEEY